MFSHRLRCSSMCKHWNAGLSLPQFYRSASTWIPCLSRAKRSTDKFTKGAAEMQLLGLISKTKDVNVQAQGLMRSDLTQAHLQFVLGHRTVVSVTVRMWRCERSFCHVVKLKLEGPGCNRTFCLFSSWKKLGGRGFMLWMKSWRDSGWTFAHIFLCLVQTWLILSRELGRSGLF